MKKNVPSMPPLPSFPSSAESQGSEAPFTEESGEQSSDSDVGELEFPSHDPVPPPPIASPTLQPPVTEVKVSAPPKRGIPVVATRKGFYNQMRYAEGDAFTIRSEEDWGEWFKCVDLQMEKKRVEFLKQKKLKAK